MAIYTNTVINQKYEEAKDKMQLQQVAIFQEVNCSLYLEKHESLDRVSHLSHTARGIDLIPTIHEGSAHYIKDSKLRLINEQILKENAAKIRTNPKLVFDKLSINKPVFTREEITIALSDALTIDFESGQADKQGFQQRLRKISKQLVAENLVTENVSYFVCINQKGKVRAKIYWYSRRITTQSEP